MGFKNNSGKSLKDDVNDQMRLLTRLVADKIPDQITLLAEKNIDESFEKETYQNKKSKKWQSRKNDKESGKKRKDRRGILVKTGDLRASTGAEKEGRDVIIGSDKVYAQRHNEGLNGMPKRQFIPIEGEEPPFIKEMNKFIDTEIDNILK